MAGIYVHIPFCKSKCRYCDFASFPDKICYAESYMACVFREMSKRKEQLKNYVFDTLYIGGGTPSVIDEKYIAMLLASAKKNFNLSENAEITIEMNPGTVSAGKISAYKKSGINRFSVGLQTAVDSQLADLGRIHNLKDFENCTRLLKGENFSVDIMIGLKNQTVEDIEFSIDTAVKAGASHISVYALTPEDGTPVYTGARERKTRTCGCLEKGIRDCKCDRIYHQPDCNTGWDSHRERHYFGYGLYTLTASDSENDLPLFPLLGPASRHDSHGFWYNFFSMKQFLPQANVTKLLLDSAHDAMAYYQYCSEHGIKPFIDLNGKGGRPPVYKDDFTLGDDGVPVCREGFRMRLDGTEPSKGRTKFKCPRISFAGGSPACTCPHPCSDAKYGRTVHLVLKDNPRLFNDPPRCSKEWDSEYDARTSSERCNKRQKIDYKLEDGRHRSSKMWYCRLFAIMMCQHLDAWTLPKSSRLKDLFDRAA